MRLRRSARDDRGSVLTLSVGLMCVCLLAVTLLTDAAAAFLQRQQLLALADASALAGAQAVDLDGYYESGAGTATRLSPARVEGATRRHLMAASGAVDGLRVDRIWTDGRQVLVALSRPAALPFLSGLFASEISVESWAELDYRALG